MKHQHFRVERVRVLLPSVDHCAGSVRADGAIPFREVAQASYDYRTLGLGYANLGSMLMIMGIPYDSGRPGALPGYPRHHEGVALRLR